MSRYYAAAEVNIVGEQREVCENLLRAILRARCDVQNVFAVEVAKEAKLPYATTVNSLNILEKEGLIIRVPAPGKKGRNTRAIGLTAAGRERAEKLSDRHDKICSWLVKLGIPADEAEAEACHMEHGVTDNTMCVLENHVDSAMKMSKSLRALNERKGDLTAQEIMDQIMDVMRGVQSQQPPPQSSVEEELRKKQELEQAWLRQREQEAERNRELQRLRKLIERLGGETGAEEMIALRKRIRTKENEESLVHLAELSGSFSEVESDLEELKQWRTLAADWGGSRRFLLLLDRLKKLGGRDALRQIEKFSEMYGGPQKLYRAIHVMAPMRRIWDGSESSAD